MKLFTPLMIAGLVGGNVGLLIAICAVAVIAIGVLLFAKCTVTYIDPENDEEISVEKFSWLSKVSIPDAKKENKRFLGWSLNARGTAPIGKERLRLTKSVVLYAVWDENYGTLCEFDANAVLELVYVNSNDEEISTETHPVKVVLPEVEGEIIGWAFEKNGKPAFDSNPETNTVLSVKLYPVYANAEEEPVQEEPVIVEEPVIEEPVEEIAEEAPVEEVVEETVEEVIEEVAEEVVEEETPIEEPVVEETVEEPVEEIEEVVEDDFVEVIEEPIEEEPVEEEPVEEEVQEEVVAEEPVEEIVEEPAPEEPAVEEVVEEEPVVEEPVQEEVVEEPVEEVVEEAPVEEPVVEEVAEEPVVEEPVQEEPEEVVPVIIPSYFDSYGNQIDIKYSRSIKANIIQADDTVKDYYSAIKNHILSYKGVKSRFSWKFDSFNKGREQLFKLKIRGKTICLYCALNPYEFDKTKYHHEAIDAKIFEAVPMLVKIKSGLGLKKAKELVDITMAKFGIELDPKFKEVDYVKEYPYEETEDLVQKKLVKVLVADVNMVKAAQPKPVVEEVEEVEEPVVEEVPVVEEEPVVEEPVQEEVVEEPVEEVVEEAPVEEPVVEEEPAVEETVTEVPVEEVFQEEEPVEEPTEDANEEIAPVEETVDEPVEEVIPEVVHEPAKTVEEIQYVESVSAEEVDELVVDEVVESLVEEEIEYIEPTDTKKAIINIDTLSKEFNDGDVVDLATLKAKKLIDKKAKTVKVLARGSVDKKLTVRAGEFSNTALKMIILTGGTAVHVTYKVK